MPCGAAWLVVLQVLKTPNLVSSVFFMCLPDKVRSRGANSMPGDYLTK
jgi:hypothetical protein